MSDTKVDNSEQKIRDIVAEIIEVEPEEVTSEADFVNDLGMDSMQALEIMAAVEKQFNIRIPENELANITNLKGSVSILNKYLKK